MTLKTLIAATSVVALACASAARAGDVPAYEAAPNWVEIVSIEDADQQEANDLIVSDRQVRIEQGLRWDYQDKVYRIAETTDLSRAGTQTFQWLPDKGDLIVHEISIIRDGEVIDVLEQGAELEVLRRERGLERGILDGSLTATIAIPGLAVGDQLRIRHSITTSDQALGDDVQSWVPLWRDRPATAGVRLGLATSNQADLARVRVSWPDDLNVRYQSGPNHELDEPEVRDGYRWLEVEMPLPEADPLPRDAPQRYRLPTTLQVGTFADWAEVSAKMAPLYRIEGSLDSLPDLVARVDAIAAQPLSDLKKAVDALELVQEDIRYLMNGLDGGNYIPQDVASTWELKYGDCKAKTVMLLALLDHLGIEAEAVLVSTNRGNAVPVSLPIPGAFNHVLVRAVIDGQEYFLDGTSSGANIKTVGNVPPFEYYLPIQDANASLIAIEQTLPRVPEGEMHFTFDGSAGVDLPTIGSFRMVVIGPGAVRANAIRDSIAERLRGGDAPGFDGRFQVTDVKFEDNEDDSEITFTISGIMPAIFSFDGRRAELEPSWFDKSADFTPDRARRQWRDIPVSLGRPSATLNTMRLTLPFDVNELEIDGNLQVQAEAAGKTFSRNVELDGNEVFVFEQVSSRGGEVAPEDILEERRKSQRIASETLTFVAPEGVERRWRFAGDADRSMLEPLEEAMARAIEFDPEESRPYLTRARFRSQTYDFEGSLEDFTAAIDIEATADLFKERAEVYAQVRDWVRAKADYEEAYALDPSPARAIALARVMENLGEVAEAKAMLELESGDTETQQLLAFAIAELEALQGNKTAGLQRIADELAADPNNPALLNGKCWFISTWQYQLSQGEEACRLAVERGENTAQALDSRAMYLMRVGDLDRARADIEEALSMAPGQEASLLLRGLIKLEQGDETGEQDVRAAIERRPGLMDTYSRWGFKVEPR
ncbi:MAG: DUF3857 domain-containing protein [Pseudomonadota bacterium]